MKNLQKALWVVLPVMVISLNTSLWAAGTHRMAVSQPAHPGLVSDQEQNREIWQHPNFKRFVRHFIKSFMNMATYHIKPAMNFRDEFLKRIEEAGGDLDQLYEIYEASGLSFDKTLDYKNEIDNQVLQLLYDFPHFLEQDEEQVISGIMQNMHAGFISQDEDWIIIREEILVGTQGTLTIGEIWDCLVKAAGFGAGSVLSIAALQEKALKGGMQSVVKQVSAYLAKKAGWIGAAIMVIEFAACIYEESKD